MTIILENVSFASSFDTQCCVDQNTQTFWVVLICSSEDFGWQELSVLTERSGKEQAIWSGVPEKEGLEDTL